MSTKIEWTEATWNPAAGCSIVSPGCTHCYAMRMAARLEAMGQAKYAGTTRKVNGNVVWTGKVNLDEKALILPLGWRKPKRVFVNSMSDLWHDSIPDEFIDCVFAVMALTPKHSYQILTKRPDRMETYLNGAQVMVKVQAAMLEMVKASDAAARSSQEGRRYPWVWPLRNVWLLISAERQQELDERIGPLLRTPAVVRGISAEPLLGPLDLTPWLGGLSWVIVGGESGPGARPCRLEWINSIVQQCQAAQVPVFVKQVGRVPRIGEALAPNTHGEYPWRDRKGGNIEEFPDHLRVRQYPGERE